MQNNSWLKLALFSFIGIIISIVVLGFISPNSSSMLGYDDMLMQQSGTYGMMGNMNNSYSGYTTMPMLYTTADNMSGMGTMSYSQTDNNTIIMNNLYQMQIQINQMQTQMTQLQQMMSSMGSMQTQSMTTADPTSMSGMSGMGMMNMGGSSGTGTMSTMPSGTSTMSTTPSGSSTMSTTPSGSSSSMSSMPMM